jgi:hypothetical protein
MIRLRVLFALVTVEHVVRLTDHLQIKREHVVGHQSLGNPS